MITSTNLNSNETSNVYGGGNCFCSKVESFDISLFETSSFIVGTKIECMRRCCIRTEYKYYSFQADGSDSLPETTKCLSVFTRL